MREKVRMFGTVYMFSWVLICGSLGSMRDFYVVVSCVDVNFGERELLVEVEVLRTEMACCGTILRLICTC
jgi:hypothetical protein